YFLIGATSALRPSFFPLPTPCGALDGVEHGLVCDAIFETRRGKRILFERGQEISDGVDEGVLVADDVPGRPPGADVRMNAFGDHEGLEALIGLFVRAVVLLQLVHALEVEREGPFTAINLEGVVISPAAGEARRLEYSDARVLEAGEEVRVVVYSNFPFALRTFRAPRARAGS